MGRGSRTNPSASRPLPSARGARTGGLTVARQLCIERTGLLPLVVGSSPTRGANNYKYLSPKHNRAWQIVRALRCSTVAVVQPWPLVDAAGRYWIAGTAEISSQRWRIV